MAEQNGKKEPSAMDVELRAIRRVAKALEGLSTAQKMRVVDYVRGTLLSGWEQLPPSGHTRPIDPAGLLLRQQP